MKKILLVSWCVLFGLAISAFIIALRDPSGDQLMKQVTHQPVESPAQAEVQQAQVATATTDARIIVSGKINPVLDENQTFTPPPAQTNSVKQ